MGTAAVDRPFSWPPAKPAHRLRVAYVPELFERDRAKGIEDPNVRARVQEWQRFDHRALDRLREIGFRLDPISLPSRYPTGALALR